MSSQNRRLQRVSSRVLRLWWSLVEGRSEDAAFLLFLHIMRFVLLVGIMVRFSYMLAGADDQKLPAIAITVGAYFIHWVILWFLATFQPGFVYSRTGAWFQIVVDVAAYSGFYWLRGDSTSAFYVFYAIPLFVAAHYFPALLSVSVCLAVILTISSIALGVQGFPPLNSEAFQAAFLETIVPASLLCLAVTVGYLLFRRARGFGREALEAVQQFAGRITSSLAVSEVLGRAVNDLSELTNYPQIVAYIKKGEAFVPEAWRGYTERPPCVSSANGDAAWDIARDGGTYAVDRPRTKGSVSRIVAPVMVEGDVLGALGVQSDAVRGLGEGDRNLVQSLASTMGIAIQNARLHEQTERQLSEMTALYEMGQALFQQLDSDRLWELLADSVLQALPHSDGVVVHECLPDGSLRYRAWKPFPPDESSSTPMHVGVGIAGIALETKEGIYVPDTAQRNEFIVDKPYIGSIIVAPLWMGERRLGTVSVYSRAKRRFRDRDLHLVGAMASSAALALANAEALESRTAERERLKRYLTLVRTQFTKRSSLKDLYGLYVRTGAELLEAEDCSMFLADSNRHTLSWVASSLLPPHLLWSTRAIGEEPGVGLTSYVAATGRPLRLRAKEIFQHHAHSGAFVEHLRYFRSGKSESLLAVPILDGEARTIGVLKVENKMGHKAEWGFNQFDQELLSTIAEHAASEIQNAGWYRDVEAHAVSRARGRLAGEIHELITIFRFGAVAPVTSLGRALKPVASEELIDRLECVERGCWYVLQELSLILSDLKSPVLERDGLAAALNDFCSLREGPIEFATSGETERRLPIDIAHAFYRIGQEAIHNALRHNSHVECLRVQVLLEVGSDRVELTVKDNGCGLDAERVTSDPTCFGIQRMIHRAGEVSARISIRSTPNEGTEVRCVRPLVGEADGRQG